MQWNAKCEMSCRQRITFYFCFIIVYIQQVGNATCMLLCFSIPCMHKIRSANYKLSEKELQYFLAHMKTSTFWSLLKPSKYQKWPSEAKTNANRLYIHTFKTKVNQIADTFENLRFWLNKVSKNVNTFEKVISKVKNTDGFLKVTCWKCDTFVTDFQKLKDVLSKTITFEGLESWGN